MSVDESENMLEESKFAIRVNGSVKITRLVKILYYRCKYDFLLIKRLMK